MYVEPEDIASLDITGSIGATSAQERITKVEHGKGLVADGVIDWPEFYEAYYEAESVKEGLLQALQLAYAETPLSLGRTELAAAIDAAAAASGNITYLHAARGKLAKLD